MGWGLFNRLFSIGWVFFSLRVGCIIGCIREPKCGRPVAKELKKTLAPDFYWKKTVAPIFNFLYFVIELFPCSQNPDFSKEGDNFFLPLLIEDKGVPPTKIERWLYIDVNIGNFYRFQSVSVTRIRRANIFFSLDLKIIEGVGFFMAKFHWSITSFPVQRDSQWWVKG